MSEEELVARLRSLIKDPGRNPEWHQTQIYLLRKNWPLLWQFIEETIR